MGAYEQEGVAHQFERARDCIRGVYGLDGQVVEDFNRALQEFEQEAWKRGFDLAADVADGERDRWAEMLLQVSAAMRGKDRADGYITTSIYPDPDVYDWQPEPSMKH